MKLSEIMTTKLVTLQPEDSLDEAIRLFELYDFRHLPIVRGGALVSLLSRRDVCLATGWDLEPERKARGARGPVEVREIMRDRIVTLTPEHHVEAATSMMVGKRVGAIPILSDSTLVGIVTTSDLMEALRARNPKAEWSVTGAAKVAEYMYSKPDTLTPGQSTSEAGDLCRRNDLRHLAITDGGAIVGLVSELELCHELDGHTLGEDRPLSHVMVTDVVTIGPNDDLAAAADSMLAHRVSALPVVEDREFVGLLTNEAIIQHFTARHSANAQHRA